MELLLIGLLVEILTKASEKFKVSQTYLALGLAIILGAGYYVATNYYAIEWQQIVEAMAGVYAASQLFYNIFKKRGIFNQKDEQKK